MANSRRAGDSAEGRPRTRKALAPERVYVPDGDTIIDFIESRAMVDIICGPLGSAKTIGLLHKVHVLMAEAHPSPDGKRRSRVIIVRNTYSDLVTTTMAKWREWWPEEEYGRIKLEKPPCLIWRHGDVDAEIWFLALDQIDDIKKLRSLEPSIVVFNELQYIARDIFDEATSRVGRYPADVPHEKRQKFVLADMNAPDEGHWTAVALDLVGAPDHLSEAERKMMVKPKGWGIWIQPPAVVELFEADGKTTKGFVVNPKAENLLYLGEDYYREMLAGKSVAWVRNRLMVQVQAVQGGSAVWPMFQPDIHVAKSALGFLPQVPLVVGLDFGRSPAAVIGQAYNGRIYLLSEVVREGMSTEVFAPILKRHLAQFYPGVEEIQIWGDPTGNRKGEAKEITPFQVLRAHGLIAHPAPHDNDLDVRLDTVVKVLNERQNQGAPRLIMDPKMLPMLKGAMVGGYRYAKLRTTDQDKPVPDKNRFSHVADALQYLCLGLGEGRALLKGSNQKSVPVQTALYRRGNVVAMPGRRKFGRA